MTDSTIHFEGHQLEFEAARERWGENFQGLLDGFHLRAALAANGDDDFRHSLGDALCDCNGI